MNISRRDFLKLSACISANVMLREVADHFTIDPGGDIGELNIIIFVLDTLSARHMSLYGYPRETTPNLTKFAERAIVYHSHYAAGNYTPPGTASLLTGTYPWTHRAYYYASLVDDKQERNNIFYALGDDFWRVGFGHNPWVDLLLIQFASDIDFRINSGKYNLQNFTFYNNLFNNDPIIAYRAIEEFLFQQDYHVSASSIFSTLFKINILLKQNRLETDNSDLYPSGLPRVYNNTQNLFEIENLFGGVKEILNGLTGPKNFAYIHLYPPHEPYMSTREYQDLFLADLELPQKQEHFFTHHVTETDLTQARNQYDRYIANVDFEFGHVVEFMQQMGLLDNSIVVVTSDHGQLFERGVHGHVTPLLYEPLIHIPLLISLPGQQHRENVQTPTSCVDVLPTLARLAGRDIPSWSEGELLPRLGGEDVVQRNIFSIEAKQNPRNDPLHIATVAMRRGDYKLIWYKGYKGYSDIFELYDIANDPDELVDLFVNRSTLALDLKQELFAELNKINETLSQ